MDICHKCELVSDHCHLWYLLINNDGIATIPVPLGIMACTARLVCEKSWPPTPPSRIIGLFWQDAISVGGSNPSTSCSPPQFVWPAAPEPSPVIRHSLSNPLQSPRRGHTASISTGALIKVTFNDPDVTLELEPALTGSAGSRGEPVFVFQVTLN